MMNHYKRFDEAEPLLLGAYEKLEVIHGVDNQNTLKALRRIIETYEAWSKRQRAAEWREKLPTTERPGAETAPSSSEEV